MGEMLPLSTEDGHALARYRAAPRRKESSRAPS